MKILNFFKKDTVSNVLAETISLSLIFYIVLVCFALCIGLALTTIFGTTPSDIPSVISNMFVWSATLIAPIIVILLLDSWKSQKNFESDSELLNAAEINLIQFKFETDIICKQIIKIYDLYNINEQYYFTNALYTKPLSLNKKFLNDFYINIERFIAYTKIEELKLLTSQFMKISNELLYLNENFANKSYKPIYNELIMDNNLELVDRLICILNQPERTTKLNFLYTNFTHAYQIAVVNYEIDKNTGEEQMIPKSYEELYNLMNSLYEKIDNIIKQKNRA